MGAGVHDDRSRGEGGGQAQGQGPLVHHFIAPREVSLTRNSSGAAEGIRRSCYCPVAASGQGRGPGIGDKCMSSARFGETAGADLVVDFGRLESERLGRQARSRAVRTCQRGRGLAPGVLVWGGHGPRVPPATAATATRPPLRDKRGLAGPARGQWGRRATRRAGASGAGPGSGPAGRGGAASHPAAPRSSPVPAPRRSPSRPAQPPEQPSAAVGGGSIARFAAASRAPSPGRPRPPSRSLTCCSIASPP